MSYILFIALQFVIFTLGLSAIFLVGTKNIRWRRWGFVFGILGQPFWMYSTWITKQWGIFALSFVYVAVWGYGIYNYWIMPWYGKRLIIGP